MKNYPISPERFNMGSGRRFHYRQYNERFEVYSIGLEQWAECNSEEHARVVVDSLEKFYDEEKKKFF